ncbi:hypothetical protein [Duganella radicis]|nr:hypothetical protein [Duganella radicis]
MKILTMAMRAEGTLFAILNYDHHEYKQKRWRPAASGDRSRAPG